MRARWIRARWRGWAKNSTTNEPRRHRSCFRPHREDRSETRIRPHSTNGCRCLPRGTGRRRRELEPDAPADMLRLWAVLCDSDATAGHRVASLSGIRGERFLPSLYPQIERLDEGLSWMRSPIRRSGRPAWRAPSSRRTTSISGGCSRCPTTSSGSLIRRPATCSPLLRRATGTCGGAPKGFRRFYETSTAGKVYTKRFMP